MGGENSIIRSGPVERERPRRAGLQAGVWDSPPPLSFGMRMGAVVNLHHMFDGELRVALGSREALMAEHLLDSSQVGAFLQHVRAEGMAQGMRMHVGRESARYGNLLHDAAHAAGREPRPAKVDQQRAL